MDVCDVDKHVIILVSSSACTPMSEIRREDDDREVSAKHIYLLFALLSPEREPRHHFSRFHRSIY